MNSANGSATGADSGPHAGSGPHSGPLADEAGKLFEAVQEWLGHRAGGLGDLLGERVGTGSPECQLCPLCRLIGLLRAANPEVVEYLADAGTALFGAFRAAMDAHERHWAAHRSERREAGVEHIDIDD